MNNVEDRIYAECLGIRCFNESKESNGYILIPISEWTEEVCNELNKTDFSKNYILSTGDEELCSCDYIEKFSNLKRLDKSVKEVLIYTKLPVQFVRFNNTVIIKNEDAIDNIVHQIESSIIENLGIVASFDVIKSKLLHQTKPITNDNYADFKDDLRKLTDICALSANFSISKRPSSGADNQIWYELLQNANDHIPNSSERKELKITFDDSEKTFTLEYPDYGFSVQDFLAICTEGNSGNVLSDENREGRKGTGFKSVYNLFDKVTIFSGPVKCVLEDVKKNITISGEKIEIERIENAEQSDSYYPIPEFSKLEPNQGKTTKIVFHSKDDLEFIKKLIFGESTREQWKENFKAKKDYLFLDNIEKITFLSSSEVLIEFERKEYIQDNYFKMEYVIDNSDDNSFKKGENPNWKNRSNDLFEKKKKMSFLFPKKLDFSRETDESRVYCTLPTNDFKLNTPFFVNIPLLELKDDRKSIADHPIDGFSFKAWNNKVLKNGLMNGFKSVVESETSSESQKEEIGLSNWYKYFPYEYLNESSKVFGDSWEDLQEVRFLRTTTSTKKGGENVKAVAISDLVQNEDDIQNEEKSIFLPCNMYWWLHQNEGDVFTSKEMDEDSCKKPSISFIYYEDNKLYDLNESIEDKIKDKIVTSTGIDPKFVKFFLRKEEVCVGKILLEIKDYLLNDYKEKLPNKELFYSWIKKLLQESSDFDFLYKNIFIYQAYFKSNAVNYKEGKYHWLKTVNENGEDCFYDGEYDKYSSIENIVQKLKRDLYDDVGYILQQEECNSIKHCFNDLVLSPYLKYTYEKKNNDWNISSELRTSGDTVLPQLTVEVNDELINLYYYHSEKLLKNEEANIGTVSDEQGWFKKNNVALYVKNSKDHIIQASESIYYTEKEIKHELIVKNGENFFNKLENSLGKDGDFFEKNKENEAFVRQILEQYELEVWKEQAIKFVISSVAAIRGEIFRCIIKKGEESIEWDDKFSDLIKEFSIDELWKNGQVIFKLSKDKLKKLSQDVLDKFENKVSIQEKEKKQISSLNFGKELQEIVMNEVFVLSLKTGNKSLYCKGKISDEYNNQREIYLLFGEGAFGTLLRNVFQCYDFSENRICDEMQCVDLDELNGFAEQESADFVDSINIKVDRLIKKWIEGGKEDLKRALVTRFDVRNNKMKWFHARGYGSKEYTGRICPVCKVVLLSEMHALTIRNIKCTINESKYDFPMLMCKNCGDAINYTETVELEVSNDVENDESLFKVAKNSFEKYQVVFSMNGREKKKMNCEVSFLNRYIWKRIKEINIK
jgi:hypothetical protein